MNVEKWELNNLGDVASRLEPLLSCVRARLCELESTEGKIVEALATEWVGGHVQDGHVYRITAAVIDNVTSFWVHVHGVSESGCTRGARCYSKPFEGMDDIFGILLSSWKLEVPTS